MLMIFFTFANDKEEDLFKSIYNNNIYIRLLYKNAYGILKDKYLTEDAIQETYIILMKNISKISEPYSKRTTKYLVTIVRNVAINILQSNKNIEYCNDFSEMKLEYIISKNTENVLNEDIIFFKSIFDKLDSNLKNMIVLKYLYGYSVKEISSATNLTAKSVENRIFRARNKVKRFLNLERFK